MSPGSRSGGRSWGTQFILLSECECATEYSHQAKAVLRISWVSTEVQ